MSRVFIWNQIGASIDCSKVMILERTTIIPAEIDRVFAFFSDPRNLARITPPWMGFEIVSAPERALMAGDRIEYRIRLLGLRLKWVSRIVSWNEQVSFEDLQERGPYAYWLHLHLFEPIDGGVRMVDRVEYRVPLGFVGRFVAGWWVDRSVRKIFDYRTQVVRDLF